MTTEALWNRYAATWSAASPEREAELEACLADDASYCDPAVLIEGRAAISAYMGQFQDNLPGGYFRIRAVYGHHNRSLAHWSLLGTDGVELMTGTSVATLVEDGRFHSISGFFDSTSEASAA